MARRNLAPCAEPGCPELTRDSHCVQHQSQRQRETRQRNPRSSNPHGTKAWRKARRRELEDAGHRCRDCGQPTDEVDHLNGDSSDHRPDNLRARCPKHHRSKTATHDQQRDEHGRFTPKRHPDEPNRTTRTTTYSSIRL